MYICRAKNLSSKPSTAPHTSGMSRSKSVHLHSSQNPQMHMAQVGIWTSSLWCHIGIGIYMDLHTVVSDRHTCCRPCNFSLQVGIWTLQCH